MKFAWAKPMVMNPLFIRMTTPSVTEEQVWPTQKSSFLIEERLSMSFTKSHNCKKRQRKKQEVYCARQCVSEDLQRCANSRCPTNGFDNNRNNNFSMWLDNVLRDFLAAIPAMKVSLYFYGIKHAFYIFNF